jgi:hypothetical protein
MTDRPLDIVDGTIYPYLHLVFQIVAHFELQLNRATYLIPCGSKGQPRIYRRICICKSYSVGNCLQDWLLPTFITRESFRDSFFEYLSYAVLQ